MLLYFAPPKENNTNRGTDITRVNCAVRESMYGMLKVNMPTANRSRKQEM